MSDLKVRPHARSLYKALAWVDRRGKAEYLSAPMRAGIQAS